MPVPNPVRYAVAAMWVLLALAVLRTILTIAFKDDLIDAWLETRPGSRGLPREVAADGAPTYVGVALIGLVVAVPLVLAAIALPKGKSWARTVAIIFAVLGLLGVVAAFLAPSVAILRIINVLVAMAASIVIVGLITADAKRFFTSARPVR